MYLIRRIFKMKPGMARKGAEIIYKMGKQYEDAGQRTPCRTYITGNTVPGPLHTVYMDWTEEALRNPYRKDNPRLPTKEGEVSLWGQLSPMLQETWIEFYEMYVPD